MVELFDFAQYPVNMRFYGGLSGQKYGITIDNEDYILKFSTSYGTNAFSEYIGSHLYAFMGIPVHETLLGTSGRHITVACKDFCHDEYSLYEFSKIANAYTGRDELKISGDRGIILSDIMEIIEGVPHLEVIRKALTRRFWDMFIVDSLIANPDRNSGNWGILVPVNERHMSSATPAPVFDNGNSMSAKLTDEAIIKHLKKSKKERIEGYLKAASIFQTVNTKGEGHKINPYSYCMKHENPDCDAALLRLKDRIPSALEKTFSLINEIPLLSESRKDFYIESIECRYKYGLSPAFKGL